MLTLEEMNQAMGQAKDNLVVQGQLLHRVEAGLERFEADLAASRRDFDERFGLLLKLFEASEERRKEDREQIRFMQAAMAQLFERMDRFIRGLESDGHAKGPART